jgi:hypothetical protein
MRNLERRRHQEDLLYHTVAYLVSLDKLFDDQAKLLREQISRAEQAEVTVRMHQVRVAQAEARTTTAISSEAVETTRISANGNPNLSTSVVVPGGLPRAIPVSAIPKIHTER